MVSRRNFLTIVLMMLILLFMFQFTGVAKQALNEYDINSYEKGTAVPFRSDSMFRSGKDVGDSLMGIERSYALFVGNQDSEDIARVVSWWCTYTKRGLETCDSLGDYEIPREGLPEVVILDGRALTPREDLPVLKELVQSGVHLIFARLPETNVLERNREFRDFLGIRSVEAEQVEIQGVHLFEGFLLGSEKIYEAEEGKEQLQDLELTIPWYMTGSGTKTYIMGMLDEDQYKNEDMPAIVWRKSDGDARVFCVNGDYLSHMYGMGFLSAMMAEADSYEIHPIVNAQNFTIVNFSGFAEENDEELTRLYSRSQPTLYREVLWPDLISVTQRTNFRISLMATPRLDYANGAIWDSAQLPYYLKLLKEEYGEAGASMGSRSDTPLEEKLSEDSVFFKEGAYNYAVLSAYAENAEELLKEDWQDAFPKLRTVATGYDEEKPVIDYAEENITLQHATSDGRKHTYSDNLALMGYETALGYSNILLDMQPVSYPESSEDYWENLSREVSKNLCTYWKDYSSLSQTTLSESDARIRKFLALDYRSRRMEGQIFLYTDIDVAEEPIWFLLKLNGETPAGIQGGLLVEMGGGYYLLEAAEQEVIIDLEESKTGVYNK